MKNTLTETKNTLQGINSGVGEAEDQIKNVEHKEAENTQSEQQKEKGIPKHDDSVRILWDNFKFTNIHIMGVLEGEEREQEIKNLFEKVTENFPNLVKEIDIHVQEAQRVPNKMNPKNPTPRHIIIKMQKVKDKERILKAVRKSSQLPTRELP